MEITVIGGGTGISNLLKSFKGHFDNINAIVAMSDDGGSSGRLRDELNILPPGDVRNCLVALSNTEPIMRSLLQHRFQTGSMQGQNVGNIIIAALYEIYGSFDRALLEMENVFNLSGHIYPVTLDDTHIVAELESGDKVVGESFIPNICHKLQTKIMRIYPFPKRPRANRSALKAIERSDIIVFGPGSLYTSLIPNLLVDGVADELKKSRAKKYFILNAMTERGETDGYGCMDHVNALLDHGFFEFDHVIANTNNFSDEILRIYEKNNSQPIFITDMEIKKLNEMGIDVYLGEFAGEFGSEIRHLGDEIVKILNLK